MLTTRLSDSIFFSTFVIPYYDIRVQLNPFVLKETGVQIDVHEECSGGKIELFGEATAMCRYLEMDLGMNASAQCVGYSEAM